MAGKFSIAVAVLNVFCFCVSGIHSDHSCGVHNFKVQCTDYIGEYNNVKANLLVDINLCNSWSTPTVSITVDVDSQGVHVTKTYETSVSIPVNSMGSFKVSITSNYGDGYDVLLEYTPSGSWQGNTVYQATVRRSDCDDYEEDHDIGVGVIVGISVGALICLSLSILGCYCCCCRRKNSLPGTVIMAPNGNGYVPSSQGTNVPYVTQCNATSYRPEGLPPPYVTPINGPVSHRPEGVPSPYVTQTNGATSYLPGGLPPPYVTQGNNATSYRPGGYDVNVPHVPQADGVSSQCKNIQPVPQAYGAI